MHYFRVYHQLTVIAHQIDMLMNLFYQIKSKVQIVINNIFISMIYSFNITIIRALGSSGNFLFRITTTSSTLQ